MPTLTVTVSKTCQVRQFEPVVVTVSETVEYDDNAAEVRMKTYSNVTKAVTKFMDNEITKWTNKLKQEESDE